MIKKFNFILALLFLSFSCKTPESPKPVAEKFLNAMNNSDFSEASKYSTESTVKLLKQFERIKALSSNDLVNEKHTISIISEEINGSSAIVYFREEGDELDQKISLKLVSPDPNDVNKKKEWKVDLKKEELPFHEQLDSRTKHESL
jgi:hypothetical protein